MKLRVYKVFGFDPDMELDGWGTVEAVRVLDLDGLRKEFMWAYNSGHIGFDIISDYEKNPDYKKENWNDIGSLSAGTMIDIMNDLINYNASFCYYVAEIDI